MTGAALHNQGPAWSQLAEVRHDHSLAVVARKALTRVQRYYYDELRLAISVRHDCSLAISVPSESNRSSRTPTAPPPG